MADPVASRQVNAASFNSAHDDVFSRIAARYDFLCDLFSLSYMRLCMPIVGWAATGGDASAYAYLLTGVRGFPGAQEFADEIAAFGFADVAYERMSLGIVAIHVARKPESAA